MKVLLSVKPEYAEKIMSGCKKYEYRRNIFKTQKVNIIVVYASNPVKKIIGEFEIEQILSMELNELWNKTANYSGIDKEFYDRYFIGKNIGHAIKIKNPKRYFSYLDLNSFNVKQAPQSFLYLTNNLIRIKI
jgi:predicted transcriptional regulator